MSVAPFHVLHIPVFRVLADMPYCPSPMFWMTIFSVLESSQPWVSAPSRPMGLRLIKRFNSFPKLLRHSN